MPFAIFAAACLLAPDPVDLAPDLETLYNQANAEVSAILGDKRTWTDPSQREKLKGALRRCGDLRLTSFVPLLLDHIELDTSTKIERSGKPLSTDKQYPAMSALIRIGLPAVPALLGYLKNTDLDSGDPVQIGKFDRVMYCLVFIHEKDDFKLAVQMVRRRITLEMTSATEQQRKNLQKALDSEDLAGESPVKK